MRACEGLQGSERTVAAESSKATLRGAISVFLVGDIASTIRWYQTNLGFNADPFPESPPHAFCILRRDDVAIFLQQLDGYRKPDLYQEREGGVWNVYLRTEGVRELFQTLSELHDVEILEPLCPQPYGETEFVIRDPNGYALVFAERL
jgi:catechol 2,3-dioxygenase-like lactoylglutathione lyase family enzyme